jgi:hypothetical protein
MNMNNPPMEEILKLFEGVVPRDKLYKTLVKLVKRYGLFDILVRLAFVMADMQGLAQTDEEDSAYDKSWRALLNLARGAQKWFEFEE